MTSFSLSKALLRWIVVAVVMAAAVMAILVFTTAVVFAQGAETSPALSSDQQTVLDTLDDYTGFAPYDAGIILPAQITPDVFDSLVFIDTRTAEEFATATIKGARHIEWRDVFSRLDEIPTDKKTVLFCNTGALSAQSAFGLRALGYENVLILQTGFDGWVQNQNVADKS